MSASRIGKIRLDNAEKDARENAAARHNGRLAKSIEICNCPPEYSGTSCQVRTKNNLKSILNYRKGILFVLKHKRGFLGETELYFKGLPVRN